MESGDVSTLRRARELASVVVADATWVMECPSCGAEFRPVEAAPLVLEAAARFSRLPSSSAVEDDAKVLLSTAGELVGWADSPDSAERRKVLADAFGTLADVCQRNPGWSL
jgi:hypothetical protein